MRRQLAMELVAELRQVDRRLAVTDRPIAEAVAATGTTLPELFGIGAVLAARILGEVGHV